jgi:signal transduction histidine kinase/ActR/RegA family two-component response regulator
VDRLLLERFSPSGVLVDENFNVLQFRGRTGLYFEVPPGEPTTSVLRMSREGLLPDLREALEEVRSSHAAVRRERVRVRRNGAFHEVTLEVSPVEPAEGGQRCFLVLFQDAPSPPAPASGMNGGGEPDPQIAALQKDLEAAHQRLEQTESDLRESDRRKDEFLATLAHELRNPIAPIRNAIEIMRLSEDPQNVGLARDVLDRQVRQLSRIVDDLIDVSRIVERKIDLRRTRIVLDTVIGMAVESTRSFIEACRHRLVVSLPPRPVYVNADAGRLAQALINLLNNAAKYMNPGGRIWITAERVRREDDPLSAPSEVRISVRDIGVGVDPKQLAHIFDMYSPGTGSGRMRRGIGTGLTLAKSLVEMHGGRIEAHSGGLGRGSEFVIYLPAVPPMPALPNEEGEAVSPTILTLGTRLRVLVVDDNADQVRSLSTLLTLLGHDVDVAANGPAALEEVQHAPPDVALIDIGLPGMSGNEVGRTIRENTAFRGIFMVALTGWGQESDREQSEMAGFEEHLVKPVTMEELQRILAWAETRKRDLLERGTMRPEEPGDSTT